MKSPALPRLPVAVFAFIALFYLCFHSTFYNFDGVACAIAVELSDFAHLVHGNHLAYGVAGWLFYRLWQVLGYQGDALLCLQVLDSLLGAAGVAVFCDLLLRLKLKKITAVLASLGLAVSQAYWLWSLEAQVYLLGTFFLALAAREALASKPRPVLLGLFHALAVLGHAGHIMFLPAGVYALWKPAAKRQAVLHYVLTLGAVLIASYGFAALFFIQPRSFEDLRVWLLGSAALNVDKSFYWHGGYSLRDLGHWARMTLRIFSDFVPLSGAGYWLGLLLAIAPLAAAGWAALRLGRQGARKSEVRTCLIWLACYAALFASWQPFTVVYRVSDLLALWLLVALLAEAWPRQAQAWLLGGWVACAAVFNGFETIAPNCDALLNREYQEALWLSSETPPEAWIVVTARGQVYVPYFAHRKPVNMRYYEGRADRLKQRLEAGLARGEAVYLTSDTISAAGLGPFLKDFGIGEAARKGDMTLYRVVGKGSNEGKSQGKQVKKVKHGPRA